ncbi:Asperfuranone cluster transcription factor afoA [Diaporthe amygdali]|uniref:Asperfuranone cluster transcription factor afoA n=1 Tax=Phomopsis amygdali TaxID=1214568 RepID=UPI0022FE8609|nr:Asperfuranone cluster transcription factor afoA [Diaporthe amygdali]KAJ0114676.1 Asperfuranone cluster transcription factor afoA [Diaporthe amygdali]
MTSMHLLPDSHASSVDQERLNAIGLGLVATDAPDQLERLARAVEKPSAAEESQNQQSFQQHPDEFMFSNETEPLTSQSLGATSSFYQSQPGNSYTGLVSLGLFEQQPPPDLALLLTNVYFDKWHFAAPMLRRGRYMMSLHLPPHMRPPMCLQYIILALGADMTKIYRKLAIPFYQRSRTYMQSDEMKGEGQHFTTIAHAQAWSLIANFEAQQLFFPKASMSLGRAIRIAQMIGLDRVDGQSVNLFPLFSPPRDWAEAEEMRRTWWVVYCSDRLICGSTGWPALINEQDIDTHLPASETSFEAGLEERTSPLTSILHLEGQNLSSFAARVLAASLFNQAFQHSTQAASDKDGQDIQTSLHWKRHREIDNDLAVFLHYLPDDVKLPSSIRCQNATFVNIILHTSVIFLHRAAILTMQKLGISGDMVHQSRARLIAAAEEILNILKMMPDVNDMLKNPMLAFSIYMASLVFLDRPTSTQPDYQQQNNLDFTLRLMILAAKTWGNPVTRSMAIQLAVDMRQRGLESVTVEKASELPLERSTVPILAKGDNDSSNFLFQLKSHNSESSPGATGAWASIRMSMSIEACQNQPEYVRLEAEQPLRKMWYCTTWL